MVTPLAVFGVTPNVLTVLGLLLNGGVAFVLAAGHLRLGGGLLLIAGAFDMLDGALARVTRRLSPFGSFFDSVLDRYSEAVVILGLIYTENLAHNNLAVMLLGVMLTGSFLISYTRARAEGLGLECKVGLLPRPERIIILAIGLVFHLLIPVLIVLVLLTNATALQRIYYVWNSIKASDRRSHAESLADESTRAVTVRTGSNE